MNRINTLGSMIGKSFQNVCVCGGEEVMKFSQVVINLKAFSLWK